jgi:hypothetical protein
MGLRAVALFALAASGCATMTEVTAGPVVAVPTKEDPSIGGAATLHGAFGTSTPESRSMLGFDGHATLKVTERTQHVGFGDGFVYARSIGAKGEALARGGLQLVFERFDEKLIVGGGPYAALLGGLTLDEDIYFVPGQVFSHTRRDRTLFTFGPMAEIDARFSRSSAVAFLGLGFGIAWTSEIVPTPPPIAVPEIFPPPPQKRTSP